MADKKPFCFVAVPHGSDYYPVDEALRRGVNEAGYRPISPAHASIGSSVMAATAEDLARANCVIAELSDNDPGILYQMGMARAMDKVLFPVVRKGREARLPFDLADYQYVAYDPTASGLADLAQQVGKALRRLRRTPASLRGPARTRLVAPFFVDVDWSRLSRSDMENLCRELLTQMGYRGVDWVKLTPELDLVAELPKKDPDGFEYRELWLVSMGSKESLSSGFLAMLAHEPEYFIHRVMRDVQDRVVTERDLGNVTVLVISLDDDPSGLGELLLRPRRRPSRHLDGIGVRVRVWTREHLTQLVQQFPQIGYKYFSEQARSTKYRKSLDELYRENVELAKRQADLLATIDEEKNKRVRAERDAAWKDISFAAAHKIGNPIFAIETNLEPLRRRIRDGRTDEAMIVADEIGVSVEKAKDIVDQFKSLTRIQEMQPCPTLLSAVLEHSCDRARNLGITCSIACPDDLRVQADPNRIAECFDELVANAAHWLRATERKIDITVSAPEKTSLPQTVDSTRGYARVLFADNGPGIPLANKARIFDAFFTTRDQGTGLGLALVRRILEGHGGTIGEVGSPTEGAIFEIYLPLSETTQTPKNSHS